MKRLLLVDDSKLFRVVMEEILSPYFQIVGTGKSGDEAIELFTKLKPDIVLLDITMPNCSGKEALERIIQLQPEARVIMVSGIGDEVTVEDCLRLGAKAYVPKSKISQGDNDSSVLVQAALKVANVA